MRSISISGSCENNGRRGGLDKRNKEDQERISDQIRTIVCDLHFEMTAS